MNRITFLLVSACLCLHLHAQDADGFQSVITPDMSGFETTGNWTVDDDGVVSLVPRKGEKGWQRYSSYLWLTKEYADFTLDLEYKHPPRGNSGVFFRCADKVDPVSRGIEVQILDNHGKKEPLGHHDCGGVIRTQGPSTNACKPAGEWNRMVVTCKGSQLTVVLNGEQVQDLDLSTSAVKDRPPKGWVGVQDHGQPFQVRNIKIKEL